MLITSLVYSIVLLDVCRRLCAPCQEVGDFHIYVIDWHKHRNYKILERYDFRNSIELLINEQLSVCAPGWHSYRL